MNLLPIHQTSEENAQFLHLPDCKAVLEMTVRLYKQKGFASPWIGYFVEHEGEIVGTAAFKGKPQNNKVEIAYFTFPQFQHQGIASSTCKMLVELAKEANPNIIITARTLAEKNPSTRVLERNNFILSGSVMDPEDGEVWEWTYQTSP